jgi:hypothetical protein
VVAAACTLSEQLVAEVLDELAASEFVSHRDGRIRGWSLTDRGRGEGERLLAAELDAVGCRGLVEESYRRFLALNEPFLECCTRWQLRDADGLRAARRPVAYDLRSSRRSTISTAQVQTICSGLASVLARAYYNERLASRACGCTTESTTGSRNPCSTHTRNVVQQNLSPRSTRSCRRDRRNDWVLRAGPCSTVPVVGVAG